VEYRKTLDSKKGKMVRSGFRKTALLFFADALSLFLSSQIKE
jgi:hypothetical protein